MFGVELGLDYQKKVKGGHSGQVVTIPAQITRIEV